MAPDSSILILTLKILPDGHAVARSPSGSSKPEGTADTGELEDWLAFRHSHHNPL